MFLHKFWHNPPPSLTHLQATAVDLLCTSAEQLPFYRWPLKSPKALDENARVAKKYATVCGLQAAMNEWFRQDLTQRGFQCEVPARNQKHVGADRKVDFAYDIEGPMMLMVEVEFGNTASLDRNLKKLCDAYHHGRSAMGVIICPLASFSRVITGGDATFEQVVEHLKEEHPLTNASPLLIIGLDQRDSCGVDLSETQLDGPQRLSGNHDKSVIAHVVRQHRAGLTLAQIGMPGPRAASQEKNQGLERVRVQAPQWDLFS